MQAVSLAINGLPGKAVTRPGPWGNPYAGDAKSLDRRKVVKLFENMVSRVEERGRWVEASAELAGKNLACHCPHHQPCHADVLIEMANGAPWVIMKRGLYYRPESAGYTGILDEAGWYTYSTAVALRRAHGEDDEPISIMTYAAAPEFAPSCCAAVKVRHLEALRTRETEATT
jgi:hypothetical protein